MDTPQKRIEADLKEALKARDKERLSTLRLLLTEIKNEKIRRGDEVDDDTFVALVRRAIKQRGDAEEQYRKGDRAELADKEKREAEILAAYLPQQVGEDEIRAAIAELVEAEGLAGPRGIGPVMKAMLARFGASTDGATINRIAREILGGG
ncbi:MAG: GatB/YqeY domain-containing protein [bacterium]|nr:GatB/YqeY domain-containing protein [bacterium]